MKKKQMMRSIDLTGMRFGRLTVVGRDYNAKSKHDRHWICRCECGNEKSVSTGHLSAGTVSSCGCLRKEQAIERFRAEAEKSKKHGETGSSLYYVWHCMWQRCNNPNNPAYRWYGAKGVRVCDEWKDYSSFAEWARANGYYEQTDVPHKDKLSIDRIDSNGNYCPENCQWITVSENTGKASRARHKNERIRNRSARTRIPV